MSARICFEKDFLGLGNFLQGWLPEKTINNNIFLATEIWDEDGFLVYFFASFFFLIFPSILFPSFCTFLSLSLFSVFLFLSPSAFRPCLPPSLFEGFDFATDSITAEPVGYCVFSRTIPEWVFQPMWLTLCRVPSGSFGPALREALGSFAGVSPSGGLLALGSGKERRARSPHALPTGTPPPIYPQAPNHAADGWKGVNIHAQLPGL